MHFRKIKVPWDAIQQNSHSPQLERICSREKQSCFKLVGTMLCVGLGTCYLLPSASCICLGQRFSIEALTMTVYIGNAIATPLGKQIGYLSASLMGVKSAHVLHGREQGLVLISSCCVCALLSWPKCAKFRFL